MSGLSTAVGEFIDQREEYVRVLKQCTEANPDYYRWQGNAEARRQLGETLAQRGVSLAAELDLESPALQDLLAQACGDPGSIVGRQYHEDEALSRWQMRAVLHVLAERQNAAPVTPPVSRGNFDARSTVFQS